MRILLVPVLLGTLFACAEDVGKNKTKAKVEDVPVAEKKMEAKPADKAEAPVGAVDTLKVDTTASSIKALGAKVTATHPVMFKDFSGKVGLDGDTLKSVSFEVQMGTLESDHPKLTEHLKNEDFFDVPHHPTSSFVSKEITKGSSVEGNTHTVSGDFTIRGNTKRITFPAKIEMGDGMVKADTEFVINRQDFSISYPGRADDLIQDNVAMTISLVAKK